MYLVYIYIYILGSLYMHVFANRLCAVLPHAHADRLLEKCTSEDMTTGHSVETKELTKEPMPCRHVPLLMWL